MLELRVLRGCYDSVREPQLRETLDVQALDQERQPLAARGASCLALEAGIVNLAAPLVLNLVET